jgi:hypothetical protein
VRSAEINIIIWLINYYYCVELKTISEVEKTRRPYMSTWYRPTCQIDNTIRAPRVFFISSGSSMMYQVSRQQQWCLAIFPLRWPRGTIWKKLGNVHCVQRKEPRSKPACSLSLRWRPEGESTP